MKLQTQKYATNAQLVTIVLEALLLKPIQLHVLLDFIQGLEVHRTPIA
jgi:hypothetical protein